MNTESINSLKQIRDAIDKVQKEMNIAGITRNEKKLLARVLLELSNSESIIINQTMMEMVNQLNTTNAQLEILIADMEKSNDKIVSLSKTVKKVSKIIGVLADITAKAISVGIL